MRTPVILISICGLFLSLVPLGPALLGCSDAGVQDSDATVDGTASSRFEGNQNGGFPGISCEEDDQTLGCPCENAEDCESGLCVLTPQGTQCSAICEDECPPGWVCLKLDAACADCPTVCVAQYLYLCRPCLEDADCVNTYAPNEERCVRYGDAEAFCGVGCSSASDDCPVGFGCQLSTTTKNESWYQCVADLNSCECTPLSILEGAKTTCMHQEGDYACEGTKTCGSEGLSSCSADTVGPEICDGLDNDCDGEVDLGACQGNAECVCGGGYCDCLCPGSDPDCEEINPADCENGESNPCNEACDGNQICIDGKWGPCDTPAPLSCTDYATCGVTPVCAPSCPTPPAEVCNGLDDNCNTLTDEGFDCIPGIQETENCPNGCGEKTKTCTPLCSWSEWSGCDEAVCEPGSILTLPCDGNFCGEQTSTCTSGCQWGEWSSCTGGLCVPGETKTNTASCNNCGTQEQKATCQDECNWGPWVNVGDCNSQGSCAPGSTQACSECSAQLCTDQCEWSDCQLNPGNQCEYVSTSGIAGGTWQCCGTGMWQFCSQECQWYDCANCAGPPSHCDNDCP